MNWKLEQNEPSGCGGASTYCCSCWQVIKEVLKTAAPENDYCKRGVEPRGVPAKRRGSDCFSLKRLRLRLLVSHSQSVSHVFSSSHNRFLVNSLSSSSGSCCFRPCCSEPESPSITCNHRGHSHSGSMNLDELTENNFTTLAHKVCACYGGVIFLSMQTPRLRESAPTFLLLTISFYSAHYFLNQPHFPRIAIPRCQHRTFSKVR